MFRRRVGNDGLGWVYGYPGKYKSTNLEAKYQPQYGPIENGRYLRLYYTHFFQDDAYAKLKHHRVKYEPNDFRYETFREITELISHKDLAWNGNLKEHRLSFKYRIAQASIREWECDLWDDPKNLWWIKDSTRPPPHLLDSLLTHGDLIRLDCLMRCGWWDWRCRRWEKKERERQERNKVHLTSDADDTRVIAWNSFDAYPHSRRMYLQDSPLQITKIQAPSYRG